MHPSRCLRPDWERWRPSPRCISGGTLHLRVPSPTSARSPRCLRRLHRPRSRLGRWTAHGALPSTEEEPSGACCPSHRPRGTGFPGSSTDMGARGLRRRGPLLGWSIRRVSRGISFGSPYGTTSTGSDPPRGPRTTTVRHGGRTLPQASPRQGIRRVRPQPHGAGSTHRPPRRGWQDPFPTRNSTECSLRRQFEGPTCFQTLRRRSAVSLLGRG